MRQQCTPYGEGHRCVPLLPAKGMLALDVVYDQIVYIEVLNRATMHNQHSLQP